MGIPFNNARYEAFSDMTNGVFIGQTYAIDVDDRTTLGLLTFGFVISDKYSDCTGTITTGFSNCPTVATSWTQE